MSHSILTLPYLQYVPSLVEQPTALGQGVAIAGRATVGRRARFGALATIRADGHFVTAGDDFWMGHRSTIHIAHALLPAEIGNNVTVGMNVTVHACTVGDGCVVEDNCYILDGAKVGAGSVVASGSVVFPRTELPAGHWCEGSPAKPVRPITSEQLEAARARIQGLTIATRIVPMHGKPFAPNGSNYVAPTAALRGDIELGADVSVWFGCELDAATNHIVVGAGTNIQDNTVIDARQGDVRIGAHITVGHNVVIQSGQIGDRSLIGIGSILAPGTVVEGDVLVAGGTFTLPGQRLTSGYMWAGRPARRLGELDDIKRNIIKYGGDHYVDYNREYLQGA
jgi:gamma-carbonic anhydrase